MIQASDLRLGNLVERITNNGQHVCYEKVKSIEGGYYGKLPSSDCHPINITPSILEKSGFTHRSDHRGEGMMMDFKKGNNAMLVYLEYEKNGGGWRTSHTSGHAKIPYVHNLQNLYFAIYGEELTINL